MKISGARIATGPKTSEYKHLHCSGGSGELDLSGYLMLPGLINAHDHLELNLFPTLGKRIYSNAGEWAADVYRPAESPVREHNAIAKRVRLLWGAIKNLISGVTTVAQHNPYCPETFEGHFPVRVLKQFGWAHSLDFTRDLKDRFIQTPTDWPFIIHAAEGNDAHARREISRLDELCILSTRTVLVHANAAGANEIELLRARGCAVIWCPSSNLATYGQTLAPGAFRGIGIALGTDSAITAGTDLLDEIRVAHDHGAAPEELYRMVTCSAAAILRLRPNPADYIAVSDTGQTPDEAIFNLNPEMVIRNGEIKLISTRLSGALPHLLTNLHPISIESRGSWLIAVDVPELMRQTVEHLGTGFRLAGKLVS